MYLTAHMTDNGKQCVFNDVQLTTESNVYLTTHSTNTDQLYSIGHTVNNPSEKVLSTYYRLLFIINFKKQYMQWPLLNQLWSTNRKDGRKCFI